MESGSSIRRQCGLSSSLTREILAAFSVYQLISLIYFGIRPFHDFSHSIIGNGPDPTNYIWFLDWWPYAILHGLNPFISKVAWAPTGFNVTWANSIPGAALLMAPITLAYGPIAALNVLCLIAPALAAVSAFVLCRHLSKSFWPSLVGGYFFGFSPYILGQMMAHVSLILVFPIPLIIYVVVLRLEDRISPARFVTLTTIEAQARAIREEEKSVNRLLQSVKQYLQSDTSAATLASHDWAPSGRPVDPNLCPHDLSARTNRSNGGHIRIKTFVLSVALMAVATPIVE